MLGLLKTEDIFVWLVTGGMGVATIEHWQHVHPRVSHLDFFKMKFPAWNLQT